MSSWAGHRRSSKEAGLDDTFVSVPGHDHRLPKFANVAFVRPRPTSNTTSVVDRHWKNLSRVRAPLAEGCGFPTSCFCRLLSTTHPSVHQWTLLDVRGVVPPCGECSQLGPCSSTKLNTHLHRGRNLQSPLLYLATPFASRPSMNRTGYYSPRQV